MRCTLLKRLMSPDLFLVGCVHKLLWHLGVRRRVPIRFWRVCSHVPQWLITILSCCVTGLLLKELAEYKNLFLGQLNGPPCRYKGPTRLMVRVLESLGWYLSHGANFVDNDGRSFHLFMTSFRHIRYLFAMSWATFVCSKVCHRPGLTDLCSIDLVITKDLSSLRKEEKGMVLNQQVGSFFTEDYRRHCGGITDCPMCGMLDSRAHRLEQCQSVGHIRRLFPNLMSLWSTLTEHEQYSGIFPELAPLRTWQARLDQIPWPNFPRCPRPDVTVVYTVLSLVILAVLSSWLMDCSLDPVRQRISLKLWLHARLFTHICALLSH